MLTEENKNRYLYLENSDTAVVSVFPDARQSSDELIFNIAPSALPDSGCYSVRTADVSNYLWNAPTSRHFAEIFITISAVAKAAYRAVRRFFRQTVHKINQSLTLRKTVFLRL